MISFIEEEGYKQRCFSDSWITSNQDRFFVLEEQLEDKFIFESIDGGNHDVMVLISFGKLEFLKFSFPTAEGDKVIRIDKEIKESLCLR